MLFAVLELSLVNEFVQFIFDSAKAFKSAVDKVSFQVNRIDQVEKSQFTGAVPLSTAKHALIVELLIKLFNPMTLRLILGPCSIVGMIS